MASHESGCAARQVSDGRGFSAVFLFLLVQLVAQHLDLGCQFLWDGCHGHAGEQLPKIMGLYLVYPVMPALVFLVGLVVPCGVLQQQRYQAGRVVGACWFGFVFLELPQTEVTLEVGFGHAHQQHLGLADRASQLGFPVPSQPQVVTVEEHLLVGVEMHIEVIAGSIPQRLHQSFHPLPGVIPAGVTYEHRIPGMPRRVGALRIRWRHRHDNSPKTR